MLNDRGILLVMVTTCALACSHRVPPEVAAVAVEEGAPPASCRHLGPVRGRHSGNDRSLIIKRAKDDVRVNAHAMGADRVVIESMKERSVGLGFRGMGGVGPEITFAGQAYRCAE
jgi:hypothetical protein